MKRRTVAPALFAIVLLAGCADTGRAYIEVPFEASGTGGAPVTVGAWTVELERADVAFGPMWMCATESASPEFCENAVLELTDTVTVDALRAEPAPLGTLFGITGTARSVMYDHGISWPETAQRPRADESAPAGHSARIEAVATHEDGRTFRLVVDLDLVPPMQGSVLVTGRRIEARTLTEEPARLAVRFDVAAWVQRMNLDRIAARGEDVVVLEAGDADYEALVAAMTGGVLPSFVWTND